MISETIDTMRNCGDIAAYAVALGGESHLLEAIRSLPDDRLVEVENEHVVIEGRLFVRPLERTRTADQERRRYWFRMTPAGEATWQPGADVLHAYRNAHLLQPADAPQ